MFTNGQLEQLAKVIDSRLMSQLKPINDKLDEQSKDIKSLNSDVKTLKSDVSKQRKDIRKIKENVGVLIKATNRDDMQLQKRVKRIEDHLHLSPLEDTPGVTAHQAI